MINKIEMSIPNYTLIIKGNKGIINDKNTFITKEDIDDIAREIRLWNESYIDDTKLNENIYYINLYDENDNDIGHYKFNGAFPRNFQNLINIIGNIYDRR